MEGASEERPNPLLSNSPSVWEELLEGIGPASILVVIESRMSAALKRHLSPEDLWQETLLHVWRDRARCVWRGLKAFRSWVLTVADHRIRDMADHLAARKRGGDHRTSPFTAWQHHGDGRTTLTQIPALAVSTTPSRMAMHTEQAAAMHGALADLPEDLREVVWLRLFEQLSVEDTAARLAIGPGAVRHRFRQGAARYRRAMVRVLASQSITAADAARPPPP